MPQPSPYASATRSSLMGGPDDPTLRPYEEAGRSALQQLVLLRWVACAGQLLTVLFAHFAMGYLHDLVRQGAPLRIRKQRCGQGSVPYLVTIRPSDSK